ncbi:MAG TPA: hypothetical protein VEC12_06840 [Bacteroidia bacterium]|nr:hypothetical protein [Bacteroidia bacterium]
MSDILDKYGLIFKNHVAYGKNHKSCKSIAIGQFTPIVIHLLYCNTVEECDWIIEEIDNALAGNLYQSEVSINESSAEISPTTTNIEGGLTLPTVDYKEILLAWISFLKTPPLNWQKMPYRSDLLNVYGITFLSKKINGEEQKYCEGSVSDKALSIASHLNATREQGSFSYRRLLDEIQKNSYNQDYKGDFSEMQLKISNSTAIIDNAIIPLEDYIFILWEWVAFIETSTE